MKTSKTRIAGLFIAITLFLAFSGQHPTGRTGAPGESTCATGCHNGGASFSGAVSISGIPTNATANETYSLTVEVTASGAAEAGFSMVALDSNDSNSGDFSNPDGSSSLRMASGREYWGHNPSQNFSGGSASWTVDWTAPNVTDDVTFYMVAAAANGNGNNSGDEIVLNEESISVTLAGPVLDLVFDVTDVTCPGDENGVACVNVTNGSSPFEYAWNNGGEEECLDGVAGGVYAVTVTDANGDTGLGMITVFEPDAIEANENVSDINCAGFEDGVIELNPSGGNGTLECFWDFGSGCTQQDLAAGFYSVTIIDEIQCSKEFEFEIREPDPLEVDIETTPADMGSNGSAECTGLGGEPFYDFEWSTGFTDSNVESSSINNLMQGSYQVTITDQNDCQIIEDFVISGSACNLMLSADVTDISCYGETDGAITLNVATGTTLTSFLWSNGSTMQSLSNVEAGTYSVTVSEGPMCSDSIIGLVVNEPDSLRAELRVLSNPPCPDIENGRVIVEVLGGNGGYDLVWSNGLTNDTTIVGMDTIINIPDTLTSLAVGNYSFTLTDSNGCMSVDSIEMRNSDAIAPFISVMDVVLELDQNGMADALTFENIDDGSFDNCGITSVEFSAGPFNCDDTGTNVYAVTARDANGNETVEEVNVTVLEFIPPLIDCGLSSVVSSSCGAVNYVQPLATDNCGVASFEIIAGLPSGSEFPVGETVVTYQATDASGNAADCSFTVTVENTLTADFIITDSSCDLDNGSIEVIPSGGTPPYQVSPNFAGRDDLRSGDYTFTVTDAEGCDYVETVVINNIDNSLVIQSITIAQPLCAGENTGSVEVEVTGGTGAITIELDGDPNNLSAGDYTVIARDELGCEISQDFTIIDPPSISIQVNGVFCDEIPAIETVGGAGSIDLELIETDSSLIIIATDEFGCQGQTEVERISSPEISLNGIVNQSSGSNGSIDVDISGGGTLDLEWTDETGNIISTEEDLSDVTAGMYTLTVINEFGCASSMTFEVLLDTSVEEDLDNYYARLYPNPAQDFIRLDFSNAIPDDIILYNTEGKVVQTIETNFQSSLQIDLKNLGDGLYLIRMEYEDKEIVKRFLKN